MYNTRDSLVLTDLTTNPTVEDVLKWVHRMNAMKQEAA